MINKVVFVVTICGLVVGGGFAANIVPLKECDGKLCKRDEYCSTFNDKCERCSSICHPDTHNYDEKDCLTFCPGRFTLILHLHFVWFGLHHLSVYLFTMSEDCGWREVKLTYSSNWLASLITNLWKLIDFTKVLCKLTNVLHR